jgi:hypothetical protein
MGRIGEIAIRLGLVILGALGLLKLLEALTGDGDDEPEPEPAPDGGPDLADEVQELRSELRTLAADLEAIPVELQAQVEDALESAQAGADEATRKKLDDVLERLAGLEDDDDGNAPDGGGGEPPDPNPDDEPAGG